MDWREDYIVCPHLGAENDPIAQNHVYCDYRSNFRACCEKCKDQGFLNEPIGNFVLMTQGKLTIAKLKEDDVRLCIVPGCYNKATKFVSTVEGKPNGRWYCDQHASIRKISYILADAMLKVRKENL